MYEISEVFKRVRLFILIAALSSCSGCASIMCHDEKTVDVSSEPPGARFEIVAHSGGVVSRGTTPARVTLKRGRGYFQPGGYTARFYGYGYEPASVPVRQGYETGWYFGGNFIFGGLIGWFIVDPLTGAMWDIKDVHANLGPYNPPAVRSQRPAVPGRTAQGPPQPRAVYRIKTNEKGEPVKDEKGQFVFEPVEKE